MKIIRSAKCSLKFANAGKIATLQTVLQEYGRVVNLFIDQFWSSCPKKHELLKGVVNSVDTWLSARLRKVAAREAIDMIRSAKERQPNRPVKPTHKGCRMHVSSTIAELRPGTGEFDGWLRLRSIGSNLAIDLPIRFHKQFLRLAARGSRLASYVIAPGYVQFSFKIETGPKQEKDRCVGVDTGIKALCSTSAGEQLGTDIEAHIERINRCKHGSKGQRRAGNALRQRMAEVAKQVTKAATLIVVENLKNITKNTKRRLVKNIRRTIGRWNVRYWLTRLEMTCQDRNVSFRTVSPRHTSQTCNECGHVDRRNRDGEVFLCRGCGHKADADINAARNILDRFLTGPYGAGCKPLCPVMG